VGFGVVVDFGVGVVVAAGFGVAVLRRNRADEV
jgi:hypothetical protein